MLGWREMESLRLPDRLTVSVGPSSYINIREQSDSMVSHGYEHFGVLLRSAEEFRQLWAELANEQEVQLEPLSTNDKGEGSFGFDTASRWRWRCSTTRASGNGGDRSVRPGWQWGVGHQSRSPTQQGGQDGRRRSGRATIGLVRPSARGLPGRRSADRTRRRHP